MDIEAFVGRARDHYVDQFGAFVERQKESCRQGASEVKLRLSDDSELFQRLYCADFVRNDDGPEVVELQPESILSFEPLSGPLGEAELTVEHLRWDDVLIHHDASDAAELISGWFEKWFDPDDDRHEASTEVGDVIHSLLVGPNTLSIDFGTASPDALWEVLGLLERQGAKSIRVSSSRAVADKDRMSAMGR